MTAPHIRRPLEVPIRRAEASGVDQWARVERSARDLGLHSVRMGIADIDGIWRGKRVSMPHLLEHGRHGGVGLCNAVFGVDIADEMVPGVAYTGWESGYPEVRLVPDPATFVPLSWLPGTAAVMCDLIEGDGTPTAVAPRHVLRRVLDRARERAFAVRIGYELEFHLFRETPQAARRQEFQGLEPILPGVRTYNLSRLAEVEAVVTDIARHASAYGMTVEAVSTEFGAGQFEVNLGHADALTVADRTFVFKHLVREIAVAHGITATFMAKYDTAFSGSSGHLHQSLWDAAGTNLFAPGPDGGGPLSDLGRHYLAGQLATMGELTALSCPTVNSYKRRIDGSLAPTTVTWGVENRTAAVRVVAGRPAACRVENRLPGADANPYLAIAAAVAGGLHGIEHELLPPDPVVGNAYALGPGDAVRLPDTLDEAVLRLQDGTLARELLGADFVEHFLATRRHELATARAAVTDWERRRYCELI